MSETVVLGIDGATWDILNPLIEEDFLPNIKSVLTDGVSGTLESTFPPITGPAWLSMATGQNPGKTGVFYFLNRKTTDSYNFEPFGSEKFHGRSYWDILSADNQTVGIFNYPMLNPPYEVNGFMVSGLGASKDDIITSPKSLKNELDEVTGGYRVKVPYADPKYQGRPEVLKSDLLEIIEIREAAIEYLITEKNPDHFFGVISATDWAQHYFWRFADQSHPLYEPTNGHENALKNIWCRVDKLIGKVAELAREDEATLMIVSDHGFGPVTKTFHMNEWLKQRGYLKYKKQNFTDRIRTKQFGTLRKIGGSVVNLVPQLNDLAKSIGESIRKPIAEGIDFDQSIACAPIQNFNTGMIYLLTNDSENKNQIICDLESLIEQENEINSIEIFSREELYHGPNLDIAPDIMLEIDNFQCAIDSRISGEQQIFTEKPPSVARSGGHNREGIFIASGSNITYGNSLSSQIYDIAPTLLCMHGVPIPEECDGVVRKDIFNEEIIEKTIKRKPVEQMVEKNESDNHSNEKEVKRHLKDLGYL